MLYEVMEIKKLYINLGYKFKNHSLLLKALTHSSYLNETKKKRESNEILEFLGDAVLNLAIAHILIKRFPEAKEGELSKLRASIVSEKGLSKIAKKLGLDEIILLGKGEEKAGGRKNISILSDAVEALFGAIYLDAGFSYTFEVVDKIFKEYLEENEEIFKDYKSQLQEEVQKIYKTLPEYRIIEEKGPPHRKTFKVGLFIKGRLVGEGVGGSKKEAEKMAAKEGLKWLKRD